MTALFAVLSVGCGDSREDFVNTTTNVAPASGALTFNFAVAQGTITVPEGTTTLDFTFYDQQNQAGNVTLTSTNNFATSVTITGVPVGTQSYQVVARNANGTALATGTGNVTVVADTTTVVDLTGALVVLTPPAATVLDLFVSNNDGSTAADDGQIDLFDRINGFIRTFNGQNGNQGIALDALGTGFHNTDTTVEIIGDLPGRNGTPLRPDSFNTLYDRTFAVGGVTSLKGSAVIQDQGYLVLADFGGSQISVVSTTATSGFSVATQTTPNPPWDMVYDDGADRLFVAFTNGEVGVYDTFVADVQGFLFNGTPDRTIAPTGLDNAHGIAYDSATDLLIVSDVGAVTVGPNTDGEIYVIANGSTANGVVTAQAVIGGSNTLLGNPVDIDLQGPDLRVAEKTNDRILIFSNILTSTGGNLVPNVATAETKPESLATRVQTTLAPDNSDIDGGVTVQNILVSTNTSNATGTGAGTDNVLLRINAGLTSILGTFDTGNGNEESVKVDGQGDAFLTGDGTMAQIRRVAQGGRDGSGLGTGDRRVNTLTSPKGLDVVDSRGLVIVADVADGTVDVLGKNGDFMPIHTTTTSGNPWDVDYDPGNDRLFVALTNGDVDVFDNYLGGANPSTATPDRTIDVTGATNMHGIVYDAANDVLLLSDVGGTTVGPNTDGVLFVVNNASTANGATAPAVDIRGAATLLGNPVDVAYDGTNLYVAEKTQNVVMRFDSIRTSPGGNIAPSQQITVNAPESVSLITGL